MVPRNESHPTSMLGTRAWLPAIHHVYYCAETTPCQVFQSRSPGLRKNEFHLAATVKCVCGFFAIIAAITLLRFEKFLELQNTLVLRN